MSLVSNYSGPLVEETNYYPFGLTMAGISSKAFGRLENKKKFNDYEENKDLDLNWLESFYRTYDPQLGRFWQVDPKPTDFESVYAAMGNNPVLKNDPLGDTVILSGFSQKYILKQYRKGLNVSKKNNPFYFKNGMLQINKQKAANLSEKQKALVDKIQQTIDGRLTILHKVRPRQRLHLDPTRPANYTSLIASGGGITIPRENGVIDVYMSKKLIHNDPTYGYKGVSNNYIDNTNHFILYHEMGHVITLQQGQRPVYGDKEVGVGVKIENMSRDLNGVEIRKYDKGHPDPDK